MATALSNRSSRAQLESTAPTPAPEQLPVAQEPAPRARPARRPSLVAGGLALVAVCGLGGWTLAEMAGKTTPVVVAAQPIAAGQLIDASKVRVVNLDGTPQIASIPSADQVIGHVASRPISAGEALTSEATSAKVSTKSPIIGISVKPSGMPNLELRGGDQVIVTLKNNAAGAQIPAAGATPAPSSAPTGTSMSAVAPLPLGSWSGIVNTVGEPREDGTRTVDVQMSQADAAAASQAAGTGDAVIVFIRRGSGG